MDQVRISEREIRAREVHQMLQASMRFRVACAAWLGSIGRSVCASVTGRSDLQ
jgi:hypothetical protein